MAGKFDPESLRAGTTGNPPATPGTNFKTLPGLLRGLGTGARDDVLDLVKKVDSKASSSLEATLQHAPGEMVRLVAESVDAAAKALEGGLSEKERAQLPWLQQEVLRLAHDPRNTAEAADAIEGIGKALERLPTIHGAVEKTLDTLEDKGVLGKGVLGTIVKILGVLAAGGVTLARAAAGGEIVLRAGPATLSVDRLGHYSASLAVHNPLWAQQALVLSVGGTFRPKEVDIGGGKLDTSLHASRAEVSLPSTFSLGGPHGGGVSVGPYAAYEARPGAEPEVEAGARAMVRFGATPEESERRNPVDALVATVLSAWVSLRGIKF